MAILFFGGTTISTDCFTILTLQINDVWIIDVSPAGGSLCDDTSRTRVANIGIENVQGTNYRFINLELVDNSHFYLAGRYYERFGGGDYLLPRKLYVIRRS